MHTLGLALQGGLQGKHREGLQQQRGAGATRAHSPQAQLLLGTADPFSKPFTRGSRSVPASHAAWHPCPASPGCRGAAPSSSLARGQQGSPVLRGALRQAGREPRQFLTQRMGTDIWDTWGGLHGEETSGEQCKL